MVMSDGEPGPIEDFSFAGRHCHNLRDRLQQLQYGSPRRRFPKQAQRVSRLIQKHLE